MRYFPPEWHPQDAVMLTWPHDGNEWSPSLAIVENVFIDLAKEISNQYENVIIACRDSLHLQHVKILTTEILNQEYLHYFISPSLDVWARDHGPISVFENNNPYLLDFIFNAWGEKYPAELDNAVTKTLYDQQAFPHRELISIPLVLEGGSIETDGKGTLLTTTSCLLNPNRNPDLSQSTITNILKESLGIEQIYWIENGNLAGDDTDGHIDTLARFCPNNIITYVECQNSRDEHYRSLQAMQEQLTDCKTLQNQRYELIPLPLPQPKRNRFGDRLPATYANFLIINNAVIVPTYDDPADAIALDHLQSCFPKRKLIPVNALPLIEQFGSIHCVTMQIPDIKPMENCI